jgi:hypothetical protein
VAYDLRSAASSRTVFLSPTPERVEDILTDLTKCEEANHLPPLVGAEALFGRLGFVMQTTVGAVGRAATQPLLQRAHEAGGQPAPFTPAIMRHMLRFFRALPLLPTYRPSRRSPFGAGPRVTTTSRRWSFTPTRRTARQGGAA